MDNTFIKILAGAISTVIPIAGAAGIASQTPSDITAKADGQIQVAQGFPEGIEYNYDWAKAAESDQTIMLLKARCIAIIRTLLNSKR